MRITLASLILMPLLVGTAFCQTSKTGTAVANGICNIANSGNNVQKITIANCGIGPEQAAKIVGMLKAVLSNHQMKDVNTKLDELLRVASQPASTMMCVGNNNCVQGDNYGSQILNQYGAAKLSMTDSQRDSITEAMKPFAGKKVQIFCHDATEDSTQYANQLTKALQNAGLIVDGPLTGIAFGTSAVPAGVSLALGSESVAAGTAMANAMGRAGLISKPISASSVPAMRDAFTIYIAPNR